MSIISQIKEDQLTARKDRQKLLAQTLTTLIGEIEKIGKDDGNRETTDAESVAVLKKFRKGVEDTLNLMTESSELKMGNTTIQDQELAIVDGYIPLQLTADQLTQLLLDKQVSDEEALKLPTAMKFLKENYAGLYDGRMASLVIKDIIDNGVS